MKDFACLNILCRTTLLLSLLFIGVVSCTNFQEEDIPVNFGVDAKEMLFPEDGGNSSLTVSSGSKWDVASLPSWITLRSISRSGLSPYEWTVSFSAAANDEYNREGLVVFKSNNETAEVPVTQDGKKGGCVAVESVSVSPTELTLTKGESASLSYIIYPSNASIKNVTWKSSSSSVATVSSEGQVEAVDDGVAVITVTTEDGGKTASCTVTVNPASVSSVSLDKESLTLKVGESSTLTATIQPENAANKRITWSSSNTSIATVDSNGRVTAIGIGSAIISVTTEDGGKKAECQVFVKEPTRATSIAFTGTDFLYSARVGNQFTISVDIKPEDAYVELEWSVSDDTLAEISGEGRTITLHAKDYGPSTLRVRDKISGLSVSEEMNAGLADFYWTENTGKTYNGCPLVEIEVGEKRQLNCYYKPEYATRVFRSDMKGFWYYEPMGDNTEVSNIPLDQPSFFSIDENGMITGKKIGLTRIHVFSPIIYNNAQDLYVRIIKTIQVPEAVDMGLSVKWASFNLGASKPEEYGDYYAWGDTEPYYSSQDPLTWKEGKTGYNWASYKWCMGSPNTLTKYCGNSEYGYNGFTDTKTVLNLEDDAANVNLGSGWRMPTDAEWAELRANCTWTRTTQNGVNGRLVTASNGNSIFLPAAGDRSDASLFLVGSFGYYWSSSLYSGYPDYAWSVYFDSGGVGRNDGTRYYGRSVRPVYGDLAKVSVISVSLNNTSLSMTVGDTQTLTATVTPSNATDKTVTWSSSNTAIATVSSSGLVTAKAAGTATITVTTNDGGKEAACTVLVSSQSSTGTINGHKYVEMGNGLKWATMNIGASTETEQGDYFAWGETEPYYSDLYPLVWRAGKEGGYAFSSYSFCSNDGYNKYVIYSWNFTDGLSTLEEKDDAAAVNWGGTWRMPTDEEWASLRNEDNYTWIWTDNYLGTGLQGCIVTSKITGYKDNSIFLPAGGSFSGTTLDRKGLNGYYWSSSLNTSSMYNSEATGSMFSSTNQSPFYTGRATGNLIRAVSE